MELTSIIADTACIGTLALSFKTLKQARKKNATKSESLRWAPVVVPAAEYKQHQYYDHWGAQRTGIKGQLIEGEMAVRLIKGESMMPIGTVPIKDAQFTEKINTLVAEAEEKAAGLNAIEQMCV